MQEQLSHGQVLRLLRGWVHFRTAFLCSRASTSKSSNRPTASWHRNLQAEQAKLINWLWNWANDRLQAMLSLSNNISETFLVKSTLRYSMLMPNYMLPTKAVLRTTVTKKPCPCLITEAKLSVQIWIVCTEKWQVSSQFYPVQKLKKLKLL